MKTLAAGAAVITIWLAAGSTPKEIGAAVGPTADLLAVAHAVTATAPPAPAELNPVIGQYCVRCHNDQTLRGNLSLETFDVATAHERAATAEKMIVKLQAGMMPPPGARRPGADTLRTLTEALENVVDEVAATDPNPGRRRFQRLNRAEYERVVGDLLALKVDASRWLPDDTYLGNFDNMSDAQGLSTTLLEAYMRAATDVSRLAVGNPGAVSTSTKYTNPVEVSQHAWDHIDGTPFGTRGGMVVTHSFPADGEYVLSIQTLFGTGTGFEDVDISIDGEGVASLELPHGGPLDDVISTEPVFVAAGQHRIAAAFVRRIDGPYEDRLSPHEWSFAGGEDDNGWANYGITVLPHLKDLMITGPVRADGVSETASRRKVFSCRPSAAEQERGCAESIVSRLILQAYRRLPTAEDLAGPMSFYDRAAAEAGFETGIRTALQAVLVSPSFIFRLESEPADIRPGESYRLSDVDLASRLSFFLWATSPDQGLLEVATSGQLSKPGIVARQVTRMLEDPRSEALATRFASQWLRLQDAEDNKPESFLYPDFTGQLRDDLVRETQLLFMHLVREDRSLLELLTADYSFLNERLAGHYGIPGVSGDQFRRVDYPGNERRGVLGHGSVLLLTSMSERTSPTLRGKWVMDVLMGSPPPPPPPDIPAFEDTAGAAAGRRLTTRERLETHAANPTCNSCHRFMDPIGLALDGYDVTGRLRTRENGAPLDTRGTFYDGTEVTSPGELLDVLMKRPIPLVRNFAENMLAYAIGRPAEYYDQPAIRALVREAEANDYRMSSFIQGIINSVPFRMMRSPSVVDHQADSGS